MSNFIINPNSVSLEQIKTDIESYIASQPDAAQWDLFISSTTGQTFIELIAGLAAYLKYNNITARREAYLQSALNRSSVIGAAQMLGYSVYRGRNAVIKLNVTPANSGIWKQFDIIGTVKDRNLIVLNDTTYNAGVALDVIVVVGELLNESITATTSELDIFRFTKKDVSEDVRLFVDGQQVEISKETSDLNNYKFVIQSNPFGSVDVKSLNSLNAPIRYGTGSIIKLEWVSLKNVLFNSTDVLLDTTEGALNAQENISLYESPENDSSVKVNAPLDNEVKSVIRAKEDQPKLLKTLDNRIIDATGEDVSAAVMRLYYLRSDDLRFTQAEKNTLTDGLDIYRPHGHLPAIIGDPVRITITLKIALYLFENASDPTSEVKSIVQKRAGKLYGLIDLYQLEAEIEELTSVKVARISFDGTTWTASTKYAIGDLVLANPDTGRVYSNSTILYFSGNTEPIWPTVAGDTIVDNGIIWKAVSKTDLTGVSGWVANNAYLIGSIVKPSTVNGFIYEGIDVVNLTGGIEPTWPALGGNLPTDLEGTKLNDGDIMWVARPTEGTPSPWSASTNYRLGDTIEATDTVSSDTVGVMFQAYAFLGTSGATQPTFDAVVDSVVVDNNIRWVTKDTTAQVNQLDKEQYYVITEAITLN